MTYHSEHDRASKERIIHDVKTHGCHLAVLEGTGYLPAFVYSIGLFANFRHPEIILFGLKTEVMAFIVNYAKDEIKAGRIFEANKPYAGFLEGYDIQFLEVAEEHCPDYLGYGAWYYGQSFDFPTLQMVWPDKEHNWPWEEDFNENWVFKQPLLDRNTDFRFYEHRNLGVYTTTHVLEGRPILYVYHNEDGDWQFHSEGEPDLKDAKLVCLDQLVALDPSLNDIHYLNYGQRAFRPDRDSDWQVAEEED